MNVPNTPRTADSRLVRAGLSRASFMMPKWFAPSTWVQHAPFAFFLVEALRPRCFVELGSHYGFSFFAVCQAVEHHGLGTRCVAVDTWHGDEHAGFYSNIVHDRVKAHLDARYESFAEMKRMTFDEAAGDFADGSIDLLHIDGRHFYEDARHDYETFARKVAADGIVIIHDTQVRDRGFGVHRLWAEISARHPSFEFHHGHGLGVAAVGGKVPAALAEFFAVAAEPGGAADIRAVYERLGASLEPTAKAMRQEFKTGWKADLKRQARSLFARTAIKG